MEHTLNKRQFDNCRLQSAMRLAINWYPQDTSRSNTDVEHDMDGTKLDNSP